MPGVGYCSGKQWLFTLTTYISKATLIKLINLIQIILKLVLRLLRHAIGLKNSHHFFIQSEVQPKPIATRSHTFSGALRQPHVITTSFDWFTVVFIA